MITDIRNLKFLNKFPPTYFFIALHPNCLFYIFTISYNKSDKHINIHGKYTTVVYNK
jgi:hypothetical protein